MDFLLPPAERKRQRVKAIANEAIMGTPSSLAERRRLRLKAMAAELNISDRKFREFLPMGMPFTQVGGHTLV
jgi:hypothetical protein